MSDEERQLLVRCKKGDKAAFTMLVERYMRRAYYSTLQLVGNHADAVELSQQAFVKAYRAMRKFDTSKDFFPWLYRITRNLCFTHLRKRSKEKARSLTRREDGAPIEIADSLHDPHAIAERNELKEILWRELSELTPAEKEIIIFRDIEGLSYKEIAASLEIPIGTVMSRLFNARRKLRERMKKFL
jgi:RNA polymerase sigma-70 factor (ECF subfamily)